MALLHFARIFRHPMTKKEFRVYGVPGQAVRVRGGRRASVARKVPPELAPGVRAGEPQSGT